VGKIGKKTSEGVRFLLMRSIVKNTLLQTAFLGDFANGYQWGSLHWSFNAFSSHLG